MKADQQTSSWFELAFTVSHSLADSLSDALAQAGALSVEVSDALADTEHEEAIFGEPGAQSDAEPLRSWMQSRVTLLAQTSQAGTQLLAEVCAQQHCPLPKDIEINEVKAQDWVSLTQSQFEPIPIGSKLWITPSWHSNQAVTEGRIAIVLDPGLAFGTGSHATTRLCLQWLDAHPPTARRVIDYGCGSGILAIAAAKLGARQVIGVDIDEQALASAAENARINGVELRLSTTREPMPAPAPVVLANILASPLKVLAPLLEGLVCPGGTLVLAGLLDPQVKEVAAAYSQIALSPWRSDEGWTCLVGSKRGRDG